MSDYDPEFVKEILDADKEPARATVWCLTCEDWFFCDDHPCQNIDCPHQQLKQEEK